MTRRLLAVLSAMILTLAVTVQAQPPAAKTDAAKDPAKVAPEASADTVVGVLHGNSREYKQFEDLILRLAQRMDRSPRIEDRDKATALRKAIDLANKQAVENRFATLLTTLVGKTNAKNLTTDELEKAAGQNEELVKILRDMLELLLTDNEILRKREEAIRLAALIKQIDALIRQEKVIQATTDGNKVDSPTIGKEQGKATQATESVARQMGAKPNEKSDGKEGEAKKGDPNAKPGDPKEDYKGNKGDPKDPKNADPKDPKAGDPKAGDPKAGEPKAGDSKAKPGDQKQAGDSKSSPKPGDPKDPKNQQQANNKPSEPKAKPDNKGDAKPSDSSGKPSDSDPKQANAQSKPSQGQPQQGQTKPNTNQQQADNNQQSPKSQDPQQQETPGKKQVQDAIEGQKKTEEDLAKNNRDDASKKLDKVIEDLEKAKKELEKRLKQLREEELERLLANLQARCERMLAMQIEVYEGTKRVYAVVQTYPDKKPTRPEEQRSQQLSTREGEIVKEANKTMQLLEAEGSAVAFAMTLESVRDDMSMIEKRLDKYDSGQMTQRMEEDVIAALKDMIEALKKAQQDMKDKKNNPQPPKPGPPPPQRLLDLLAEIKLIKTLQLQVNKRTKDYGGQYQGEQTDDKLLQDELANLGKRQEKIEQMTKDIATGKNR